MQVKRIDGQKWGIEQIDGRWHLFKWNGREWWHYDSAFTEVGIIRKLSDFVGL